jgi:hypothetical protein
VVWSVVGDSVAVMAGPFGEGTYIRLENRICVR